MALSSETEGEETHTHTDTPTLSLSLSLSLSLFKGELEREGLSDFVSDSEAFPLRSCSAAPSWPAGAPAWGEPFLGGRSCCCARPPSGRRRGCGIVGASAFCAAVCRAFAMAITVFEASGERAERRSRSLFAFCLRAGLGLAELRAAALQLRAHRDLRGEQGTSTRRLPQRSPVVSLYVRCPCPSSTQTWR